jgi:hypothetical protein
VQHTGVTVKSDWRFSVRLFFFSTFGLLLLPGLALAVAENTIDSRSAVVDGLKLHYLTAGHGPTAILLRLGA